MIRIFDVSSDYYQGSGYMDARAGAAAHHPVLFSRSRSVHVCGDFIGPHAEERTVLRDVWAVERRGICSVAF